MMIGITILSSTRVKKNPENVPNFHETVTIAILMGFKTLNLLNQQLVPFHQKI